MLYHAVPSVGTHDSVGILAWIAALLPYLACRAFLEARTHVTASRRKGTDHPPLAALQFLACTSANAEAKNGFSSTPKVTAPERAMVAALVSSSTQMQAGRKSTRLAL